MARSTKADAQRTRERILDMAEREFHRHGVSRTSLEQVARAAGVTRGAVYWHFRNKADLFNAMMNRVTLPLESEILRSGERVLATQGQERAVAQELSRRTRRLFFLGHFLATRVEPGRGRREECSARRHGEPRRFSGLSSRS